MPAQKHGMRSGPGDIVEDYYNAGLSYAGGKFWRGLQQLGATALGKGLMLGALFAIAAAAYTFTYGSYAGILTHGAGAAGLGESLQAGLGMGMATLGTMFGAIPVAIGGAAGWIIDRQKNREKLSPADAEKLAQAYALMRNSPQKEPMQDQSMTTPEKSFRAAELDRRARAAGAHQLRQGYGPK